MNNSNLSLSPVEVGSVEDDYSLSSGGAIVKQVLLDLGITHHALDRDSLDRLGVDVINRVAWLVHPDYLDMLEDGCPAELVPTIISGVTLQNAAELVLSVQPGTIYARYPAILMPSLAEPPSDYWTDFIPKIFSISSVKDVLREVGINAGEEGIFMRDLYQGFLKAVDGRLYPYTKLSPTARARIIFYKVVPVLIESYGKKSDLLR